MKTGKKNSALECIKKEQLKRRVFTLDFKAENLSWADCGRKFDPNQGVESPRLQHLPSRALTGGYTMKTIRAFLLTCLLLANSAFANTFGTDHTDLWWNPNESGWGVTATQQGEIIFLTFFVYATDNRAAWYTAQIAYSTSTALGQSIYTGPMYQTTGPWLGTFFNPSAVGVRQVGTATLTTYVESGTLTYSVDGVSVTKALVRQTFRSNNPNGQFVGVINQTSSGCSNPLNNGSISGALGATISSTSTTFSMTTDNNSETCTYSGNYAQYGRMGESRGTFQCPGRSGTYTLFEMETNRTGITARFSASSTLCSTITGRYGGGKL